MNLVLSFSILGISASVFLGTVFLSKGKGKTISNAFLGVFFLMIAIRVGKLLAQEFAPTGFLNVYFNLMQAAFLAIGPVVWLYSKSYLLPNKQISSSTYIHFLCSAFFLISAFSLRAAITDNLWVAIYWVIQLHPVIYIVASTRLLLKSSSSKQLTRNQRIWLYGLLSVVLLIAVANILFFTLNFPFYFVTALLLIITLYLISFVALNNNAHILTGKIDQKYKNLNLSDQEIERIEEQLKSTMEGEELYLNHQLKLSDIAREINIPTHVISRIINERFGMSFVSYINHLRIERAKTMLIRDHHQKVIAVALDCGFHSLSAFNRSFKNVVGLSPSEFRKKHG